MSPHTCRGTLAVSTRNAMLKPFLGNSSAQTRSVLMEQSHIFDATCLVLWQFVPELGNAEINVAPRSPYQESSAGLPPTSPLSRPSDSKNSKNSNRPRSALKIVVPAQPWSNAHSSARANRREVTFSDDLGTGKSPGQAGHHAGASPSPLRSSLKNSPSEHKSDVGGGGGAPKHSGVSSSKSKSPSNTNRDKKDKFLDNPHSGSKVFENLLEVPRPPPPAAKCGANPHGWLEGFLAVFGCFLMVN
jgi:hypothetical protein